MYKNYLGAFGNKSFIRPQYEIMPDGSLREVGDARWEEFPNGGTVSLLNAYEEETDNIRNRLLRFRINFNSDFHPNFENFNKTSNKYRISLNDIDDFDREEIIEIIDIDYHINDFLNDNTKRTIRIEHKPNKLILLKYAQECYGPFEFMISDVEDLYGEETLYTLKVLVDNGIINKYKISDLDRIILEGSYSIRRSDRIQFIYNLEKLNKIKPYEQIDYIDNEELAEFFINLLDESESIENLSKLREDFIQIADLFSEEGQMTDFRVKKICELLKTSSELSNYKVKLMEEYFRNNPNSIEDKEEYLRTHSELLDDIVRKDTHYDARIQEITDEIHNLEIERGFIEQEIKEGQNRLNEQKEELDKFGEQVIAQKQQDLENLLAEQKKELSETEEAIIKAKDDLEQKRQERDIWQKNCDKAKNEYNQAINNLEEMIVEWAENNRNTEIIKLFVSHLEKQDETVNEESIEEIKNLNDDVTAEQVVSILINKINNAGRNINKDEAYNYLISVIQNYITVFAGEPGTGKTSLCKLLAKSLGLYDDRFAEILVERGWTSSRDLIGYYNPLTKEIEETQPAFSNCMKQLTMENRENIVKAPYFILLDEANLSPIEYYWSHFNYFADNPSNQRIIYQDGTEYFFGSELKFLATINYDQTTEDLSPRFLDRAWVISMKAMPIDSVVSSMADDTMVDNSEEVISINALNRLFNWKNFKDKKINQITKTRLDRIISKMKDGNHTISPRSINSIIRYYIVAEEYMSSKEVALDYAISQKILPCINGNGKQYGEFLKELMNICKENQLNKSANIISKIIERSEHEFYGFFSL